jgi:hypothetical protein
MMQGTALASAEKRFDPARGIRFAFHAGSKTFSD